MTLYGLSTDSILKPAYEENKPYLKCPKKLQVKIIAETKTQNEKFGINEEIKMKKGFFQFETKLKWRNIIFLTLLSVLGIYYALTYQYLQRWKSFALAYFIGMLGGFGVTGGVHRYWTHRSYKANVPVRIFLMLCYCSAGQNRISDWVRDHRIHHQFSETNADPHNSNRGFFFAHVGWLMMKRHPEVVRKRREVDISDVLADPVVAFSEKYFIPLQILIGFVLPTVLSVYLWNDSWYDAITLNCFIRYIVTLNFTWSVNSVAHLWGNKPYDRNIAPVESLVVSAITGGEGWHNYHHVFPWDYKASELGSKFNRTTSVIDFFAYMGWVTDRKKASPDLIKAVIKNRGDGSHPIHQEVPMPEKILD